MHALSAQGDTAKLLPALHPHLHPLVHRLGTVVIYCEHAEHVAEDWPVGTRIGITVLLTSAITKISDKSAIDKPVVRKGIRARSLLGLVIEVNDPSREMHRVIG